MGFGDAVTTCLTKYATFGGRARRSEYWWFVLAYFLAGIATSILDAVLGTGFLYLLLVLAVLVPSLAVSVRRMHDIGRSGWFLLLGLIPIVGTIVLIVMACQDSQPHENAYGPSPKPEPSALGG